MNNIKIGRKRTHHSLNSRVCSDAFPKMNCKAVARDAFSGKIRDLEFLNDFKSKSTLTESDAIRLGKEMNNKLAKRRQ